MTDLASWLLEQIAEDEAFARKTSYIGDDDLEHPDFSDAPEWAFEQSAFVARFRCHILAESEAKRRIVEWHSFDRAATFPACDVCMPAPWPCLTLKLLALPYADRPGYREEWRP